MVTRTDKKNVLMVTAVTEAFCKVVLFWRIASERIFAIEVQQKLTFQMS